MWPGYFGRRLKPSNGLRPSKRRRRAVVPDGAFVDLDPEPRTLRSVWDGLECYAAYGDDLEPAPLAQAATRLASQGTGGATADPLQVALRDALTPAQPLDPATRVQITTAAFRSIGVANGPPMCCAESVLVTGCTTNHPNCPVVSVNGWRSPGR